MATMKQRRETKTAKEKNKLIRAEDMRERIKQANLITDVIDISNKLMTGGINQTEGQQMKAAADIKLKLLNKVLPELKAVEQSGGVTMLLPAEINFKIVKAKK